MLLENHVSEAFSFQKPEAFEANLIKTKQHNSAFCGEMGDELKKMLRKQHIRVSPMSYQDALSQSKRFWARYELVNRVMMPDDPVYSIILAGTALSTSADNLTWQAASSGQGRILEIIMGGEATSTAVNRLSIGQAGTSITANSAITPVKFNSRSAAAAGTYGHAGTQSITSTLMSWAFNAFGGFVDWKAAPGEEIYYVNSEVISLRSASGTSTVSSTGIFEEL